MADIQVAPGIPADAVAQGGEAEGRLQDALEGHVLLPVDQDAPAVLADVDEGSVAPEIAGTVGGVLRPDGIEAAEQFPFRVEDLHPVVVPVRGPDPAPGVDPQAVGKAEFSGLDAGAAHGAQQLSLPAEVMQGGVAVAVGAPDGAVGASMASVGRLKGAPASRMVKRL